MRSLIVAIPVVWVWLAATLTSHAAIFYVATTGSDVNPGTQAAPFLTIGHAASVTHAGDTVIVENGTYSCSTSSGQDSILVLIPNGGTASAPITFEAQNPYGAVLDGLNDTTAAGFSIGSHVSYINIRGFEIKGFGTGAPGGADGIDAYRAGVSNIAITGNKIHDIGRMCTDSGYGLSGIFVDASNVTIQQNMIYDIGRYRPGENGCQPRQPHYETTDHGIYMDGGRNNLIINNVFWRCERGWAIQVYPHNQRNLSILNNTFVWGNPYRKNSS